MKKAVFLFSIIVILLSGCNSIEPTQDTSMIYTQAAQTVQAQMNAIASLTPPTPTLTITPTIEPTATATLTPEPSLTPSPTWAVNAPGKASALILLYNVIGDSVEDDPFYQWESSLYVGTKEFEQQMLALKDMGYETITVSTLAKAIREGAPLPPRPVIITFDTNKLGVYKKAFPIMKSLGYVGTVYLTVNFLDGKGVMTSENVKELAAAGWEIGSKGMSGISVTDAMNNGSLGNEISTSRLELEKRLGVPVTSFSYPGGDSGGGEVVARVQSWGYNSAVGLFKSTEHSLGTLYYLARYEIRKGMAINDFLTILPWKNDQPLSDKVINAMTPQPGAAVTQPEATQSVTP